MRRIADYATASFGASTDFKVGVAVMALRNAGCSVTVRHRPSTGRRQDEAALIRSYLAEGHRLLNTERNYDYRVADRVAEEARILSFVAALLQNTQSERGADAA